MATEDDQNPSDSTVDIERFLDELDAGGVGGPNRASHVFARVGDSALPRLVAAMQVSRGIIRLRAALMLGDTRSARAIEPLIAALRDDDPRMRAAAAVALGKIADSQAFEPLPRAISDGVAFVACNAVSALGKLDDVRVVETLYEAVTTHQAYTVRDVAALELLGRGESGQRAVNEALTHPDAATRAAAFRAIGRAGEARAFPSVLAPST